MTILEYTQLKQQVIYQVSSSERHNEILNSLKEMYKDDINSVRRFEQIRNIKHLLAVLEIRDVLSEDNVAPLKDVVRQLPNCSELLRSIADYEEFRVPGESNTLLKRPSKPKGPSKPRVDPRNIYVSDNSVKTERIFKVTSEEIGTQWRNLARYLKTRECVIMGIDSECISQSDKARKMLELHYERADPQRWFFELCNALDKVHRTDLMLSLQQIMSMNI